MHALVAPCRDSTFRDRAFRPESSTDDSRKKNRDLGRVDRAFLGSIGNPGEARPINARLERVASLKPAASSDSESLPESESAPSHLANFAPPRAGNQRGPATTTLALPVCTASRALHFVATERESNVSTRTPRAVPRPCTMASQAVVSAVAASPVASQPRGATAGRASGFLSGGVKVPRRSAFARTNAKPVRAVTRAAAEVRHSSHGALRAVAGARHRRCREPRPQGSAVYSIWMDRKAERGRARTRPTPRRRLFSGSRRRGTCTGDARRVVPRRERRRTARTRVHARARASSSPFSSEAAERGRIRYFHDSRSTTTIVR